MEDRLREEILEMTQKIEPLIEKTEIVDNRGIEVFTNMRAYISDSKHFLKAGNLIKSFEAILWAWAILELGQELEIFKIEK